MQPVRHVLGVALGLALMVAGLLLEGGSLSHLYNPSAALVVLGGALGAAVIANPFRRFAAAFRGEADAMQRVFGAFGKGALRSGFVGALLGAIHVFANLDRPEQIGPGVALAFLSVAYGFGVNLFLARPLAEAHHAR